MDNLMWGYFLDWLEENDAKDQYLASIKEEKKVEFLESRTDYSFILEAFYWSDTPEGHGFWSNIYGEWGEEGRRVEVVAQDSKLARRLYPKGRVYKNYIIIDKA